MVFGMFPLALKFEEGAESRAPMAVVVIGALLTSTILAVVVIPAVYVLLDDLQSLISRRRAPAAAPVAVPAHGAMVPGALAGVPALAYRNGNGNGHAAARDGWLVRTLRLAGLVPRGD